MTTRQIQFVGLALLLGAAVAGTYYAVNTAPTDIGASPPSMASVEVKPMTGSVVLDEPSPRSVATSSAPSSISNSTSPSPSVPERPSAESLQRKYAKATDGDIKYAHENLSKDLHKRMDDHLAEEIRSGRYELVELPKGQDLSPAASRTESFRVESFPDDTKNMTSYKIARCEPEKLPEAADLVFELKWLAQEIDSRKIRSH